jgi:hypothetical protein
MLTRYQIAVQAADEALADPDALPFDADPASTSGRRDRFLADRGRGPGGHPRLARGQARIAVGRQRLAGL